MSALDIEQAGNILRAYAAAVIDEYENGGTVHELDYIVQLQRAVRPESTARAQLTRIAEFCDEQEQNAFRSLARMHSGAPFPALVSVTDLREILRGESA
jgi:hypothetical protein